MASKRQLKKEIRMVCGDIAGCCLFSEAAMKADKAKIGEIIVKVAVLQEETIREISFSFDKTLSDFDSAHQYNEAKSKYNRLAFATLKKQLSEKINEVVTELNALIPQESKEANINK